MFSSTLKLTDLDIRKHTHTQSDTQFVSQTNWTLTWERKPCGSFIHRLRRLNVHELHVTTCRKYLRHSLMCVHMLLHNRFFLLLLFFPSVVCYWASGLLSPYFLLFCRIVVHVFLCSPEGLSPCTALALRALAQRISEVCYRTSAWAVKRRLSKKPKETNKKKEEPASVRLGQHSNLWQFV